ncbi:15794_t:CDS:2, partial [Acaulospora colombiana]
MDKEIKEELAILVKLAAGAVIVQNDVPQDLAVAAPERWKYELCGTEEDIVEVESISISPDPPKPGEDLEITASGKVKQTLEEGAYADVTVKLGLIKLLRKEFDICEEARKANATIQCPVEPGDYTLVQKVALPKEIPPGEYCQRGTRHLHQDHGRLHSSPWTTKPVVIVNVSAEARETR